MKQLLLFLLFGIICLCSCQKQQIKAPLINFTADYKKAESFLYKQNDSAFFYYNKVVTGSRDSLQVAMALNHMAVIQSDAGDHFGSQESLSSSLKFLNEENAAHRACLSSDYNELGMTSFNLRNYDLAITYYDEAIRFADNKEYKLIFLNNKANAYQKKKVYDKALKLYQTVLRQTDKSGSGYARLLTNLATTKWLKDPSYNASLELLHALRIRQEEKDQWGQNSSYAHLADYYMIHQPDSAFSYAKRMYMIAVSLQSPDDQLEALQKLIKLGPVKEVRNYFKRYEQISDSLQTARNAAKNQFALIRYEAEKNKADKLELQRQNDHRQYQIIKQRALLYSALAAIILISVSALIFYKRRKRRLQLESETAIRESQLKTSKKVHDVVANGLYRMMAEIENQDKLDKEQLLDQIELMYERSRDISYEYPQKIYQPFNQQLAQMILAFATGERKVVLVGNNPELWVGVSEGGKFEIEHVLQEVMINMKKHSQANLVTLKFAARADQVNIFYQDDGIGLPQGCQFKNGLISTGNRIKTLGGTINFDRGAGKGLQIQISFPFA